MAGKVNTSTTNNSATAWSSGLAGDAYHYINTGVDALVLRTQSGTSCVNFLGDSAGSQAGKAIFYNTALFGTTSSILFGTTTTLTSLLNLKQDALTGSIGVGAVPILEGGLIRCLKVDSNLTLSSTTGSATVGLSSAPTLTGTLTVDTITKGAANEVTAENSAG